MDDKWNRLREIALAIAVQTRPGNLPKHENTEILWWDLEQLRILLEDDFDVDIDAMKADIAAVRGPRFPGDRSARTRR